MYQGYEDGIIREWMFDPEQKSFKVGFEEWGHLDAIRDIVTIPEYDLLISTSRVVKICFSNFLRMVEQRFGMQKTRISITCLPIMLMLWHNVLFAQITLPEYWQLQVGIRRSISTKYLRDYIWMKSHHWTFEKI